MASRLLPLLPNSIPTAPKTPQTSHNKDPLPTIKEMVMRTRDAEAELNLPPGFRFHPTDEELVVHYLCRKAVQQTLPVPIIAEVELYKFDPWQLPEMALFGNKEWYFFTPRDRKYPNGSRPNRAAGCGYWKATGADKPVTPAGRNKPLGIKKALVFYAGKAPKGAKTNWIMHEYRLSDVDRVPNKKGSLRLDDWVLCRLYNKKSDWKKDIHRPQVSEDASFASSFEAVDDVAWDSRGSPISDVDNDVLYAENQASNAAIVGARLKEDDDWFMDLKLEDLSNSFEQLTGMLPYQDNFYYPGIGSPVMHSSSSQLNLMMPRYAEFP